MRKVLKVKKGVVVEPKAIRPRPKEGQPIPMEIESELPKGWKRDALHHAVEAFPEEACGLVLKVKGKRTYRPCSNVHATPGDYFEISAADYMDAEDAGEVVGVFHSHPNASANPSVGDVYQCRASGVTWYIVGLPSGVWKEVSPKKADVPLIGRKFLHGVVDCYTLIRDAMKELHGIEIPDFKRTDDWWLHGENLYAENFKEAGFEVIPAGASLQPGDVLLIQVRSNVPNHGAVYVGDGAMIHHMHNRESRREMYGGYWERHTTHRLRHKELMA